MSPTGYPRENIYLHPMDENFIENIQERYYNPTDTQPDFDFERTHGKKDFIKSLYSDKGTTDFEGSKDKYEIISRNQTEWGAEI